MKRKVWVILAAISFACFTNAAVFQQHADNQTFAGTYNQLHPAQKRLVDDWFLRFSETIKKPVITEEGYNNLPLSVKTTFNAVTHALLRTTLKDSSGKALGESAILLIDKIDSVSGKISGAAGDEQFRIYVQLKPGTIETLNQSMEFRRRADNTVYHKGYPVCFRSAGLPSIQVSIAQNGINADIDVDYRSSKFPVFLINGHLSASNSDVRAGDNDARHNSKWLGLTNWWRNLLGLPYMESIRKSGGAIEEAAIPREPGIRANAKPEVAIHDFLNSWLVEQKPHQSLSYFSEQGLDCIEVEYGKKTDRGMVRYLMLKGLQEINKKIGKVENLSDAVQGIRLQNEPRSNVIDQPHQKEFVLYNVREDLAAQFNCTDKLDPGAASTRAARSKDFGKYYGALFRLKAGKEIGETVATIWAKEDGYWKLVSYDEEPEYEKYRVPDMAIRPATPALIPFEGDIQLVRASRDFMEKWFVRGNVEQAFSYLSRKCHSCANLYRNDDIPEPQSVEEAGRLTRKGMDKIAEIVGKPERLEEAISAPKPGHSDIRVVHHPAAKAYIIAALPDYMGEDADCGKRTRGEDLIFRESQEKVYGNFYAVGFRIKSSSEEASIFWTVWHKEGNEWRIVSYHVLAS